MRGSGRYKLINIKIKGVGVETTVEFISATLRARAPVGG